MCFSLSLHVKYQLINIILLFHFLFYFYLNLHEPCSLHINFDLRLSSYKFKTFKFMNCKARKIRVKRFFLLCKVWFLFLRLDERISFKLIFSEYFFFSIYFILYANGIIADKFRMIHKHFPQ